MLLSQSIESAQISSKYHSKILKFTGQVRKKGSVVHRSLRRVFSDGGISFGQYHQSMLCFMPQVCQGLTCSWGGSRLVNLRKPCDRLTPTGKQVLKRICKGKRPYGLKSWPDEDYMFLVKQRGPCVQDSPLCVRARTKTRAHLLNHGRPHFRCAVCEREKCIA